MKISYLAGVLFLFAHVVTAAGTRSVVLPNEEFGIASIQFPASWKLTRVTNGIEGISADGAVYISAVAIGNRVGLVNDLAQTQQILQKHRVTLDKSTQKENRFTVNGLDARELVYQGRDEDGRATVSFCKFSIGDKMVVTTYWVSTNEESRHADEVRRIVLSLKATNSNASTPRRTNRKSR